MSEDDLLEIFEKVNVTIGDLNPCIIKAWFDTDCDNLLRWICSSISNDCYVSAQEQSEYDKLECIYTNDQLDNQIRIIEDEFPDILQTELNASNIDIANYMIQILEEEQRDCDYQLRINQILNESLLKEYSKLSSEEIQLQLEEESAQECCLKLSNQLDTINNQTFHQVLQYRHHLNNFEEAEVPVFINNTDITDPEEKFLNTISNLHMDAKFDSDFLELSVDKHVNTLSELGSRIFDSRISSLAVQVEIEGLHNVLRCLKQYNFDKLLSQDNPYSIQSMVELYNDQQKCMLKDIEESSLKLVEQYVNQPILKCSQNELAFLVHKSEFLHDFCANLMRIFIHFVIIYNLYLQEKLDIRNSGQFFRSISKYVNHNIQDSGFRKEAMLKVISDYENFCSKSIEDKFTLIGDFGRIQVKNRNSTVTEIVEDIVSTRNKKNKMEKHYSCTMVNNIKQLYKPIPSVQILQDFLISDPTSQIIVVPCKLQMVFHDVNKNLRLQNSAVKHLFEIIHKKEQLSKDKWLCNRHQLWIHFLTDGQKVLNLLDQFKAKAKEGQLNHKFW